MMRMPNPKRRQAAALQDLAEFLKRTLDRSRLLECGGLTPLFVALGFLMLIASVTVHAEASSDFDAANRLYEKGDYSAAAAAYQNLVTGGNASPALLFNLGNAYFKNGQIGRAIAAYRQAEQIDPRDPDIRANLKFALGTVQGNDTRTSAIDRALNLMTINERGIWTALALWIWFGSLALGQIRPTLKIGLKTIVAGAAIFAICFGAWYAQGLIERATERKVVVTTSTAVVRFGPLEESQVAFNVRDGNELKLLGKKEKWLQVADASNRSGWIPENDVVRLP
jgi:uncharacterized protein YgiM (DUF1202 family)